MQVPALPQHTESSRASIHEVNGCWRATLPTHTSSTARYRWLPACRQGGFAPSLPCPLPSVAAVDHQHSVPLLAARMEPDLPELSREARPSPKMHGKMGLTQLIIGQPKKLGVGSLTTRHRSHLQEPPRLCSRPQCFSLIRECRHVLTCASAESLHKCTRFSAFFDCLQITVCHASPPSGTSSEPVTASIARRATQLGQLGLLGTCLLIRHSLTARIYICLADLRKPQLVAIVVNSQCFRPSITSGKWKIPEYIFAEERRARNWKSRSQSGVFR